MKIAISGSTGFLGRALLSRLESSGFNTLGIKRFSSPLKLNSNFNGHNSRLVANEFELVSFFKINSDIKVVIHAATNYGRDNNELFNSTTSVFWSNVEFPIKLMEEAIRIKCHLFINIDSFFSSEYSEYQYLSNYSLSKKHFREWGSLCANKQLIRFVNIRLFHLYGPGDNFDPQTSHVLPALLRKFHEAKLSGLDSVTLWGSGTPRREFLHVDDLAKAVLFLLQGYDEATAINVGTGVDIEISELASLISEVTNFKGSINWDTSKPDGTPRKLLDVSQINQLGWNSEILLTDGIKSTYEWFVQNHL